MFKHILANQIMSISSCKNETSNILSFTWDVKQTVIGNIAYNLLLFDFVFYYRNVLINCQENG